MSNLKSLPPVDLVRHLFDYNPETGWLTRKVSEPNNSWRNGQRAGFTGARGYRKVKIKSTTYLEHRIIWLHYHGFDPGSQEIDHINRNRSDNRIANLRLPRNRREHNYNRGISSKNTSGRKGVSWYRPLNKWVAKLRIDGVETYLGCFDDPEEAARFVEFVRTRCHGAYACHG